MRADTDAAQVRRRRLCCGSGSSAPLVGAACTAPGESHLRGDSQRPDLQCRPPRPSRSLPQLGKLRSDFSSPSPLTGPLCTGLLAKGGAAHVTPEEFRRVTRAPGQPHALGRWSWEFAMGSSLWTSARQTPQVSRPSLGLNTAASSALCHWLHPRVSPVCDATPAPSGCPVCSWDRSSPTLLPKILFLNLNSSPFVGCTVELGTVRPFLVSCLKSSAHTCTVLTYRNILPQVAFMCLWLVFNRDHENAFLFCVKG